MTTQQLTKLSSVIPCLRYRDARAAIEWLTRAFGFTAVLVVPDEGSGPVEHAELSWDNGLVMIGSEPVEGDGRLAWPAGVGAVYVIVDDPDAHHRRAVAAGAEIVQPLKDENYGSRGYTARDPEGVLWTFGTYRPQLPT
jgi:uncharacterized glyoxalase superfamily protein PhnB